MATYPQPHRLTVAQFEQMGALGILHEDDRIELIGGELVDMAAVNAPHMACVNRLSRFLSRALPEELVVSGQNPIRLNADTRPQPDMAVFPDILLVVEVADSSRNYDRGTKFPRYAQAGIAEAWLFDIVNRVVERHTDPLDGIYRQVVWARPGETLDSTTIPGLSIPIAAILA